MRAAVQPRENRLVLDNAAIDAPVAVDRWHQGGRMTLPGRQGSRGLKRLFVDAGVSVSQREETPVVYVGSHAAAVLGIGVDCRYDGQQAEWKYLLDFYKR